MAVLVKGIFRAGAFGFVVVGAFVAFTGADLYQARVLLVVGLLCAMLFLWLDWRARRH